MISNTKSSVHFDWMNWGDNEMEYYIEILMRKKRAWEINDYTWVKQNMCNRFLVQIIGMERGMKITDTFSNHPQFRVQIYFILPYFISSR